MEAILTKAQQGAIAVLRVATGIVFLTAGLEKLLDAGLILADPPRDVAMRGQRVRYTVDDAQVTEMVMRLEQVLGEF